MHRIVASFVVAWLAARAANIPPPAIHEPELKAAALYNIIAFTEWPEAALGAEDASLVIGVVGQPPMLGPLGDIVAKETWRGRRLKLQPVTTTAEAKTCHVLFIARTEQSRWRSLRPQLGHLPILTVGDTDTFAESGGMVQFAIEQNRLRLIVNLTMTRTAGLTISSKVLRLAQVIDDRAP